MICSPIPENIDRAAHIIRAGGLVAFPTETVYGLGANACDDQAVKRIFALKGRPHFNPLIVHTFSFDQIKYIADIENNSGIRTKLDRLRSFWPGPLTVVLPKHKNIANSATAGLDSVAIRIPAHEVALALLKACACPLAAPSANKSSYISPTSAKHVAEEFPNEIEMILDGGSCKIGIESTVISLLDDPVQLLRPGAITLEQLREVLGEVEIKSDAHDMLRSPGMLKQHYSPRTRLIIRGTLNTNDYPARVGLIAFSAGNIDFAYRAIKVISQYGKLEDVAANLYAALRELDTLDLDLIVIETCEQSGLGLAIMDRIKRAASRE